MQKGRPEKRVSITGTNSPNISRKNHSRNLHIGVASYFQKHSVKQRMILFGIVKTLIRAFPQYHFHIFDVEPLQLGQYCC